VHEGLGRFVQVPLGVAAEAGAIVEHAEQLRRALGAGGIEDGARALMEVQVPEAVDVGDLVRASLARRERLRVLRLAMASLACAQEPQALHEAAERRVTGDGGEARVFAREGEQIVVVELEAPSWMVAMLAGDGLRERRGHARVGAGVCVDLARERRERIFGGAGDVEPALDRLEGEADGLPRRGVFPAAAGELLDAAFELAGVGGCREQRAYDLKPQTGPSHARRGRVVLVGHGDRAGGGGRALRRRPYASARKRG